MEYDARYMAIMCSPDCLPKTQEAQPLRSTPAQTSTTNDNICNIFTNIHICAKHDITRMENAIHHTHTLITMHRISRRKNACGGGGYGYIWWLSAERCTVRVPDEVVCVRTQNTWRSAIQYPSASGARLLQGISKQQQHKCNGAFSAAGLGSCRCL